MPSERVESANSHFTRKNRRLILLPESPSQFLSQHKVVFPTRHGIVRRPRRHWMCNIRPQLWRAQRVNMPPPLLVKREGGARAEKQCAANPHYFRGVTHVLFPRAKTGLHGLRRNLRGELMGTRKQYRLHDDIRPRQ